MSHIQYEKSDIQKPEKIVYVGYSLEKHQFIYNDK